MLILIYLSLLRMNFVILELYFVVSQLPIATIEHSKPSIYLTLAKISTKGLKNL